MAKKPADQCETETSDIVEGLDRYHGHSMSDPGSTYRTRDEVSSMRQMRDPVEYVRKLLLDHNLVDSAELKTLEKASAQLSVL